MYHVSLALSTEQVKKLKQLALQGDQSVTGLVTSLVVKAIGEGLLASGKRKEKKEETE